MVWDPDDPLFITLELERLLELCDPSRGWIPLTIPVEEDYIDYSCWDGQLEKMKAELAKTSPKFVAAMEELLNEKNK